MATNPIEFANLVACALFEADGSDLDNQEIQDIAVSCGIIHYRKPTVEEMADEDWWGHEYGITADQNAVLGFTLEFIQMRASDRAAILKTEDGHG